MFLSTYENKLDKKGRVSVPASFRSYLSNLGYNGVVCFPSFNNYSIEFKNLELKDFTNYQAVVGEFEILKEKDRNILKPEIRIYSNPKTLTYEASIKTSFIKDYYLTMSNIDRSDYYNIKFQEKPLMIWIWLSVFMIVIGGLLRFFKNAKNS